VAVVNNPLEHASVPTVKEIGMISVARGVAVSEDERLLRVLGLAAEGIEIVRGPVNLFNYVNWFGVNTSKKFTRLHEDPRQSNREFRICTGTTVRSTREEGDMRLVICGVNVLAVPAAWEVDFCTDAAWAGDRRELVVPY